MFNLNLIKMKNILLFHLFVIILLIISCDKDDHDACHECHIAFIEDEGSEHTHDIGEFCGDELADVEANGYVNQVEFIHDGLTYTEGYEFMASEVHCEEHADHDHDH